MISSTLAPTPVANQEEAATADANSLNRLRRLALRSGGFRGDGSIRPPADVVYDLRIRHGLRLSRSQVIALLGGKAVQ